MSSRDGDKGDKSPPAAGAQRSQFAEQIPWERQEWRGLEVPQCWAGFNLFLLKFPIPFSTPGRSFSQRDAAPGGMGMDPGRLRGTGHEGAVSWSLHRSGNFQGIGILQPFGMCCSLRDGIGMGAGSRHLENPSRDPLQAQARRLLAEFPARANPGNAAFPSGRMREGLVPAASVHQGVCPAGEAALGTTFTVNSC